MFHLRFWYGRVAFIWSAVKMKTTEIAFFVSTVLWVSQKLRQPKVVSLYVCVLILSFTGIPFNATQKKLVFIVAQGRQAALVVLGSSVIKLLSLFYTFYNLCVVDDTPLFLGIRSVSYSWNILDMCAVLSIECVCAFCGRPSMC